MKLILYYDLEDAIKNVRDGFGPYKVVRNNRKRYGKILPLYLGTDYIIERDVHLILPTLGLQYALLIGAEMIAHKVSGEDPYYNKSYRDLSSLVKTLGDYHISTDVSSLSKGDVFEKKYKVQLNEKKIPSFLEEKYILVPTYGFHGNQQETSFLQEHEVGSSEYILSLGSPRKVYQLSYSHA